VPDLVVHRSGKFFCSRTSLDEVRFSFHRADWRFFDAGIFIGFSRALHSNSSRQAPLG
jgi:hypothetical protein